MTINRLLARMAVVTALNNFMEAPWPTLAGSNIFDSKIEPVEDMKGDRAFPCGVVYTDYDKDGWNKAGVSHKDRLLTVTFEMLIVQAEKVDSNGGLEVYRLNTPVTDPEIEASLDIFEAQVYRALQKPSLSADLFSYLCTSVVNVISRRGASVEGGSRLAARQITIEMKTLRDNPEQRIPSQVAAFLNKLETFDEYADVAAEVRSFWTQDQPSDQRQLSRNTFGYFDDLGARLALPPAGVGVLPPNITYIGSPWGT